MSISVKTIGLVVRDMGDTLQFYRTLGLPIPDDIEIGDNVDFHTPQGLVLGFLTDTLARQADPKFVTPIGQSMNLQFECDSPSEVDERYTAVIGAGYRSYAPPWDAFWGQRFARVIDPDDRIVNIYAENPR